MQQRIIPKWSFVKWMQTKKVEEEEDDEEVIWFMPSIHLRFTSPRAQTLAQIIRNDTKQNDT